MAKVLIGLPPGGSLLASVVWLGSSTVVGFRWFDVLGSFTQTGGTSCSAGGPSTIGCRARIEGLRWFVDWFLRSWVCLAGRCGVAEHAAYNRIDDGHG